jgi:hypothetical protein
MLHPLRRKICSMLDNGDKIPSRNRDLLCRAGLRRDMISIAANQSRERQPSERIG